MLAIRHILIGVDVQGDPLELPAPTREAVSRGLWLAQASQASVTLLSALEAGPDADISAEEAATRELLDGLVNEAAQRGISATAKFVRGRPWQELIRETLRSDVDLLVAGTRARGTAHRMLFGSTGLKLLRKCPCPVWITRPGAFQSESPLIVAADDLSPVGEEVVEAAVLAARLLDARLLLLHAAMYPLENSLKRVETPPEEIAAYRAKTVADAEAMLREHLSRTDFRTIPQGVKIEVASGRPETIIEELTNAERADLLVMGTIGRGGVPGFLIGNTAERLLSELQCSILAVKPRDFQTPVTLD